MLETVVAGLVGVVLLAGCTPKLVITNQATGMTGYGTATGANASSTVR